MRHVAAALATREVCPFWITGSQPLHLMQSVSESLAGRVGIIEMLGLSNIELAGAANEAFVPSSDYFERRVSQMSPMTSGQVFERIANGSFPGIMTLELGAASGQFFESYVFGEIYKSYANAGQHASHFVPMSCLALQKSSRPTQAFPYPIDKNANVWWLSIGWSLISFEQTHKLGFWYGFVWILFVETLLQSGQRVSPVIRQ